MRLKKQQQPQKQKQQKTSSTTCCYIPRDITCILEDKEPSLLLTFTRKKAGIVTTVVVAQRATQRMDCLAPILSTSWGTWYHAVLLKKVGIGGEVGNNNCDVVAAAKCPCVPRKIFSRLAKARRCATPFSNQGTTFLVLKHVPEAIGCYHEKIGLSPRHTSHIRQASKALGLKAKVSEPPCHRQAATQPAPLYATTRGPDTRNLLGHLRCVVDAKPACAAATQANDSTRVACTATPQKAACGSHNYCSATSLQSFASSGLVALPQCAVECLSRPRWPQWVRPQKSWKYLRSMSSYI